MLPINISLIYDADSDNHKVFLFTDLSLIADFSLSEHERQYLTDRLKGYETDWIHLFHEGFHHFYFYVPKGDQTSSGREAFRLAGAKVDLYAFQIDTLVIIDKTNGIGALYFAEGMVLGAYVFDKYLSKKREFNTKFLFINSDYITQNQVNNLIFICYSVYFNRNMINDPQMYFGTKEFVELIQKVSVDYEIDCEIYNRRKIESLKMGGLLAVNKGSFSEPAFAILKWNPSDAINKRPIVLVGKGVMFDSGGLNIKTGNSMNDMHMDMAGAGTVFSTLAAAIDIKLPIHLIVLMPITDNRPGNRAFAPGDIITMQNGKTVEIVNTDAEGRLILADALSIAKKFDPELVIDLATLTGSASRATGRYAAPFMHKDAGGFVDMLKKSADHVFERLVEFPLWDEFKDTLKSDFADLKNLGGTDAGAITAAKFLESFVDYPWIHIDIAGTAILSSQHGYQTKGASGFGTRLLIEFLSNYEQSKSKI